MKHAVYSCCIIFLSFALLLGGCAANPFRPKQTAPTNEAADHADGKTTSASSGQAKLSEEDIDTYEIVLPGAQREYTLYFLTDLHMTLPDPSASSEENEYITKRLTEFTAPDGTTPEETWGFWLSYVEEQQADGLLLGGDIIDCPSGANLDLLKNTLGTFSVPYIYTPGNHDWTYPWEYMTEKGRTDYLEKLSPYMDDNPDFHVLEYDDFVIAAVNNSSNQIPESVLEPYRALLAQSKPVLLLLHVPLFTQSVLEKAKEAWSSPVVLGAGNYGGIYPNSSSEEFLQLTFAEDSPVFAVAAGHVHFTDFSETEGGKAIPQITADAGCHQRAVRIRLVKSAGSGTN